MRDRDDIRFARIADWVEGRLSGEEARAVEELVAADAEARAAAAWLREFLREGEEVVLDSPPDEVREALVERFRAHAEGRRGQGFFERLTAGLSFEGGLRPAYGVRSVGTPQSRYLVFSSEAAEVALSVRGRPGGEGFDMDGQVLPLEGRDPGPFAVQLIEGGAEAGLTVADELGEFSFEAVPPGVYDVLVSGERVEIRIPPVELRP